MENLQNHFLIATPDINDSYFDHSVIYICEHNEQGVMGLMLTAPTDLSVLELLIKMDFLMANTRSYQKDQMVLSGGPVNQDRGFILHTKTAQIFDSSHPINDDLILTTSSDILQTLGTDKSPEKFVICLGCAVWTTNQLEQEIARNCWLIAPSDDDIIFDVGYFDRWEVANQLIGINGILSKAGRA